MKLDFVVEIDDEGTGTPPIGDPGDQLVRVSEILVPGAARLLPGGRISVGLTRESSIAARKLVRSGSRG